MWLFSFRCLHKIANTLCLSIYLLPWCLRHLWIYMIFSKSITYSRVSSISLILIISLTIHGDRKFKNWNNLIWNMQESTALTGHQIFLWKPEQFFSTTLYVLTLHFFLKKKIYSILFYMSECLPACVHMYHMPTWYLCWIVCSYWDFTELGIHLIYHAKPHSVSSMRKLFIFSQCIPIWIEDSSSEYSRKSP